MAYYKTEVTVKVRKDVDSEPITLKVDLGRSLVWADSTEGAEFRAVELVASLLAPHFATPPHAEYDVVAYFDHV